MFVKSYEMRKLTALALIAVLIFSMGAIVLSDFSVAEGDEEPSVEIYEDEIIIGGAVAEVDAFVYMGIIYVVTDDTEAEEEAGVYGVINDYTDPAIILNAFSYGEEDEEITYSVTNVLSEFKDNCAGVSYLIIAESIVEFGDDCFLTLTNFGTLYVSDEVEVTELNTGYAGVIDNVKNAPVSFSISFLCGDISYPEYEDQEADEPQEIPAGITVSLVACEEMFEYPYYEFVEWFNEANDLAFGDEANVTVYGSTLYIDGVAVDGFVPADITVVAQWEEEDMFADYPESYMWATLAIIIILAVIGFGMMGYRFMMKRKG